MKTIILAGGRGTRLAEETSVRPKPMVEIGGRPMLWHIMRIYAAHGHRDFLIACGYKGEVIKEYFHHFSLHTNDFQVDLASGTIDVVGEPEYDWTVGVMDTGQETMTGGRIQRLGPMLGDERFFVTYGDGLADIDLGALLDFHRGHGKLATVTAVHPPARFGALELNGDLVAAFSEKPQTGTDWINGGFFVFEPGVLDYLTGDDCVLESGPLDRLARDGELGAYRHSGFWQPMDTLRERQLLDRLWRQGEAPWRTW
ncbi:MAG: glucose-1-phosphate cytidylyltransferase [Gemmatimonadota bacterium]|nr:glucose-1-phosphate cytidylyltransferase [Gemmatimonadota bacterium]